MSPEGDSPDITWGEACREQLKEKPIPEKDKGRDFKELKKEKDGDQCEDPGSRIEEKISSHDARNRATRSYGGDFRIPVGEKMNQTGSHATKNVENKVANMPQPIFYVIPKDIEEPHIPKDMKKTPMEKHGSQKGEKLLKRGKMNRELWVRISDGNKTKEEKGFFQVGALHEFP